MTKYLKLHYAFFMNKYVVITVLMFAILLDLGTIYNSGIISGYSQIDMNRSENYLLFYTDSMQMIKIGGVLFSIIVSALLASEGNRFLARYTVQSKSEKLCFVTSRLVFVLFISTLFYVNYFIFYLGITNYFLPYSIDFGEVIDVVKILLLQAYVYIMITMILLEFLPSFFVVIIPIVGFWIMEGNANYETINESDFLKSITRILPNVVFYKDKFILINDFWEFIYQLIFFSLCIIFIYMSKDIG